MDDEHKRRKTLHRALLGKTDALRQLLGIGSGTKQIAEQEIPILQDMLESPFEPSDQSVEDLQPHQNEADADSIPLLTETADGQVISPNAPDLRALLLKESDRLVEEAVREALPGLEQHLRDNLESLCHQYIDELLDESN